MFHHYLVGPVRGVEDESKALLSEARSKARHYEVARASVAKEDLSLGVGVQRLHMVHQLPASQRAPALLVDVSWTGPRLVKISLSDVVLGQVTHQLRLSLRGISHL